jgi:tRNA(Arg) A34 adenosine deaminase TadA
MFEERFLWRAIELSAQSLATFGTEPFAAVVVRNGQIVGEGLNRSVKNHDPTSHGETEAIRAACRSLKTVDLRGCDLYSSCEPCALCVAAMQIAGIERLYYAAGLAESNAALRDLPETKRFTVDVTVLRQECGKTVGERSMPASQALADEAMAVIVAWAGQTRTT